MDDLARILALAGMNVVLNEDMSTSDAMRIFRDHGVEPTKLDPNDLKSEFKKLAMKTHPDRGGKPEDMALINAAYDVLKTGVKQDVAPSEDEDPFGFKAAFRSKFKNGSSQKPADAPPWATGRNFEIKEENFSDDAYFQKKLWELSEQSNQEYTIYAFASGMFHNTMSAYCNTKIYGPVAKAMYENSRSKGITPRAILVRLKSDPTTITLIWSRTMLRPPHDLEFHGIDPTNDVGFINALVDYLNFLDKNSN